ncbi:MAG: DUF349 domain-containing protein, partial [Cellulomonadaceae bacterium]
MSTHSTEPAAPAPDPTPQESPELNAEAAAQEPTEAIAPEQPTEAQPAPRPSPKPVPRPSPRPPLPRPAGAAAPAAPELAPVPTPDEAAATAAAAAFGRVDDDGTVYVREEAGERVVGQFPGVSADEAMGLYIRRFLDLNAKVSLFEARLASTELSIGEIDQTLAKLTSEAAEPNAVGDLDGLRAKISQLADRAGLRRQELEAERAAAKAAAVAARIAI